MSSQIVLSEQKSTYGSPYGFYTLTLTPSNRTKDAVSVTCSVSAHLQYSDSYTGYGVTCAVYLLGAWHSFTLVNYGTNWSGTTPISASATFNVSGLSAAQTSISNIKFKAISGEGSTFGPTLNETDCSNLNIDMYGGIGYVTINGTPTPALVHVNVNGVWRLALPWNNVNGVWKQGGK